MADAKDFQILRFLMREPFAPFSRIGGPLGLSGVTVKARLDRLVREGTVRIWGTPSPEVFRRHARFFVYGRVRAGRQRAFELAQKSETVVRAAEGHERSFELVAYADTVDAPPPPEIVRQLGEPNFAATMHLSDPKPSDCVLSPLDWRILLPLVRNPRAPIRDLARATGLSRKTVRRHRDDLVRKELLRVFPLLQGAKAPGFVLYRLFLWMPSTSIADRERVLTALPGSFVTAWTERPAGLWLAGSAPTMGHVLESRERAERIAGVTRAEFDVFVRNEAYPERLEGWIRTELRRWEDGRRRR